ncbi:MAG TPA: globin family protein [Candidatus Kapabacteria bacterium]|nr:globin family protein [Candidatus Kapabacteria bacterium]
MDTTQKELVQASWRKVEPIADTAASLFYDRLFTLDPALRPLFGSADPAEQRRKLMMTLGVAVRGLDAPAELIPVLEALGRRHAGYNVADAHYDTVGEALLWTLEQGLGEDFTPDVREAWTATYELVAGVMKRAAADPVEAGAEPVS